MKLWTQQLNKIKNLYDKIKYGFQRMFRGYDDNELFNMDITFVDRYLKLLKDFRKNHYGYPGYITEEQWDNILDEMIKHLTLMNENNVMSELKKGMPDIFEPNYETVMDVMSRHKNEFFALFSKWFYKLWY